MLIIITLIIIKHQFDWLLLFAYLSLVALGKGRIILCQVLNYHVNLLFIILGIFFFKQNLV